MAVSVTLTSGGSVIAWQTPSGISFQRFDSSHQPVGAVTSVAGGTTAWLSAQPLANGGFTIFWDATASSTPSAQNYDVNGVASGAMYSVSTPPAADVGFSSRAMNGTTGAVSTATTALLDGGRAVATIDRTGSGGNLLTRSFGCCGRRRLRRLRASRVGARSVSRSRWKSRKDRPSEWRAQAG